MTATRSTAPIDDPTRDELLRLARHQKVAVKFDRSAQRLGFPFVKLLTKPGGLSMGTFKNAAAALRWLRGTKR